MSDEIYCWGWGKDGQLGHGDRNSQKSPVKVEMLSNKPISSISCGGWHSCALTPNGDVYAWGSGRCGQLGLGDWASHRVPVLVPDLCGKGVREIACGSFHTCCLLESGSVFSWGCGRDGQLGHGDYGSPRVPTLLKALEGKVILKIVCGEYHSAALSSSGDVWTWGDGAEGQLGHDDWKEKSYRLNRPRVVKQLQGIKIVDIASGDYHMGALSVDRRVFTWGKGVNGELGHSPAQKRVLVPTEVKKVEDLLIQQIECAGSHTLVLSLSGDVFSWGCSECGQLGSPCSHNREPTVVLQGRSIASIVCGTFHSAAVTSKGQLFTWGHGGEGRLGHGSEANEAIPRLVEGLKRVRRVACGKFHTAVWVDANSNIVSSRDNFQVEPPSIIETHGTLSSSVVSQPDTKPVKSSDAPSTKQRSDATSGVSSDSSSNSKPPAQTTAAAMPTTSPDKSDRNNIETKTSENIKTDIKKVGRKEFLSESSKGVASASPAKVNVDVTKLAKERDDAIAERDNAIHQQNKVKKHLDDAVRERDNALKERDRSQKECETAQKELESIELRRDNTTALTAEQQRVHTQLTKEKKDNMTLRGKIESLEEELRKVVAESEKLLIATRHERDIVESNLMNERNRHKSEIAALEAENRSLLKDSDSKDKRLAEIIREKDNLASMVNSLQSQVSKVVDLRQTASSESQNERSVLKSALSTEERLRKELADNAERDVVDIGKDLDRLRSMLASEREERQRESLKATQELERIRAMAESYKIEINRLHKTKDNAMIECSVQLEQANRNIAVLERRLQDALEVTEDQIKSHQHDVNSAMDEMRRQRETLSRAEKDKQGVLTKVAGSSSALSQAKADIAFLSQKLQATIDENSSLSKDLSVALKEAAIATTAMEHARNEAAAANAHAQNISSSIAGCTPEMVMLLKEQVTMLHLHLQDSNRDKEETVRRIIAEKNDLIQVARDAELRVQEERDSKHQAMIMAKASASILEKESKDLQDRMRIMKEDMEDMRTEGRTEKEALGRMLKRAEMESLVLKQTIDGLNSELSSHTSQLVSRDERIQSLEQEIATLQQRHATDITMHRQQKDFYAESIRNLEDALESSKRDVTSLKLQASNGQEAAVMYAELKQDYQSLARDYNMLDRELHVAKEELGTKDALVREMQEGSIDELQQLRYELVHARADKEEMESRIEMDKARVWSIVRELQNEVQSLSSKRDPDSVIRLFTDLQAQLESADRASSPTSQPTSNATSLDDYLQEIKELRRNLLQVQEERDTFQKDLITQSITNRHHLEHSLRTVEKLSPDKNLVDRELLRSLQEELSVELAAARRAEERTILDTSKLRASLGGSK